MGMLEAFGYMNDRQPFEQVNEAMHQEMDIHSQPMAAHYDESADPNVWLDRYATFVERPRFNPNFDGYISPYASDHWGASSDIMQSLATGFELGPMQDKVDPNKIFTSDIAALKTLAADQMKIIKVFERRLLESLNDKGKFGLNEDDIEALQALTSARSAVTQINKEQIAVKKNIAELKIKQQQNAGGGPQAAAQSGGPGTSAFDVGRSMLDQIFDIPNTDVVPVTANFPTMDVDQAATVLNEIVSVDNVPAETVLESEKPITKVLVGRDDSDAEYVTYNGENEIMSDYPKPTGRIVTVDRDNKKAIDEFMVEYDLEFKDQQPTETE